jgi:hypothetical protein
MLKEGNKYFTQGTHLHDSSKESDPEKNMTAMSPNLMKQNLLALNIMNMAWHAKVINTEQKRKPQGIRQWTTIPVTLKHVLI